jgi:hypothetical protein
MTEEYALNCAGPVDTDVVTSLDHTVVGHVSQREILVVTLCNESAKNNRTVETKFCSGCTDKKSGLINFNNDNYW